MKLKADIRGLLIILIFSIIPLVSPIVVDSGVIVPPRNPSIQGVNLSGADDSTFTWTSRWQTEPQSVENSSIIVGDHIVVRSSWSVPVSSSRISIRSGFNETRNGTIAELSVPIDWPTPLCYPQNYTWESFNVHAGDEVRLSLNVSHDGDPAFDVWSWRDANFDDEISCNEVIPGPLLSIDDGGAGEAESGSYLSRFSETIAIRVLCWNYAYSENMTYELHVDTRYDAEIDNTPANPSEVIFDTYGLLGNATVNITLIGTNATHDMQVEFHNITLGNYFVPDVSVNFPIRIESSDLWNFTWTCSDMNANDTNYYSVWISSDGGVTFQLLQMNITETFYVWNSTGFLQGDLAYKVKAYSLDYTVQVNNTPLCSATNPPGSYWPGDYSDDVYLDWSTNHIITPTSPVSTTTSFSTFVPPPGDSSILVLVIGLSAGMISVTVIIGIIRRRRLGK